MFSTFTVCDVDYVYIAGSETRSSIPTFHSPDRECAFRVRYKLLDGDAASYSGMAMAYQRYLTDKGALTKQEDAGEVPICIDTIGGVAGYKTFLGISHVGLKAATTLDQSRMIPDAPEEAGGGGIRLKLTGWFGGGVRHSYPAKATVESGLGGAKAFRRLADDCRERGIGLYPDADLLTVYETGGGFSATFDAAKYLDATEILLYDVSAATCRKKAETGIKPNFRYVLSPTRYGGDGASAPRVFFSIMLPNAVTIIATVMLFSFVWQWNDTYYAGMFLRDTKTLPKAFEYYNLLVTAGNVSGAAMGSTYNTTDPHTVSLLQNAGLFLVMVPLMVVYAFTQRYFVEGIERTGVVG